MPRNMDVLSPMTWPEVKLKKAEPGERIAFVGPMASGKTWCANYFVNNHNFIKISFADKLKAICYELYGIQSKDGKAREILQEVGQDLRKHDPNVWIKYTLNKVNDIENNWGFKGVVIDDVRYVNEAKALKKNGFLLIGVETDITVRADRIRKLYPNLPEAVHDHTSEQELRDIQVDFSLGSYDWKAALDLSQFFEREKSKTFQTLSASRSSGRKR